MSTGPNTPKYTAARKRAEAKYDRKPEVKKKRANRNAARRAMMKAGKVHKGDGKDVEHVNGNALDNRPSNWRVGTRKHNRSYARTSGAHKKNPRS